MRKTILCSRYVVLASFIICNAIICSVAIWNFSIGQSAGVNLRVDIFLTVLGALALLFVFPIGCIDILHMDSVTSCVWFECLWIGIFAILEFSGAIAVSSIDTSSMCAPAVVALLGNSCSSTRVLMAFSWTCSISLFSYFFLLLLACVAYAKEDPQIWHCKVRRFPEASLRSLRGASPSPTQNHPAIVAPKPRRAVPAAMYAYRSGLSSQYDIEHFRPPTPVEESSRPPVPDIIAWRQTIESTHLVEPTYPAMSFYPQHMQGILTNPSLTRPPKIPPPSRPSLPPLPPPPPPPSVDRLRAATLPLHGKWASPESTHPQAVGNVVGPSGGSSYPRPKPTGPRSRSNSHDWRRLEPPTGQFRSRP
jgi:hypothetical protein